MKTLYIVRHAKSSWDYPELSDHERPLLEKGKKRTKLVAGYLQENNIRIDRIISSHAVRAFETSKIIAAEISYPEDEIRIFEDIYFGDVDKLFDHLFKLPEEIQSVMLVGHNPTFTYFANSFLKKEIEWLPTSGIVCIEFKTDKWEKLHNAKKTVKFVITPKMMYNNKKQKNIILNE
ncbi:MAG: phosphohistidine phosphatase SixA [Bacteroidales bacterium]|nr:phosphohistidine phosphatase SixA [Bacteroidales bacterium]